MDLAGVSAARRIGPELILFMSGVGMRPSSLLRVTRLNALIEALSARELGSMAAARLLNCSASCARNYLMELMDAGIIAISSNLRADGSLDKTVYCLIADRAIVDMFQDSLEDLSACEHTGPTVAMRDPLVVALFGAPQALAGKGQDAR
jgi:hypothetical protein